MEGGSESEREREKGNDDLSGNGGEHAVRRVAEQSVWS